MKVIDRLTLIILLIVFVTSCYTRYTTNLLQERNNLPQYLSTQYEDYRLQVNDELVIRVITTDKNLQYIFASGTTGQTVSSYRIYEDGTADFPYLPRIPLLGKTIRESEVILSEKLHEFSEDVEVKLSLKTQTFCVIGEAGRGYFPIYKDRMTIFQALALSGGISQGAALNKIKIIRTTEKGTIIKSFDIRTQSIIDSEFYYIQPNDIIYADVSNKKFWASGNVVDFMGLIISSLTFMVSVLTIR